MSVFDTDLEIIINQLKEQKCHVVRYLGLHFKENIDFICSKIPTRGRPKIKIMLTDVCAKTLVASRLHKFRHETEDIVAGLQILKYHPPKEIQTINFIQECLIVFNPRLQYSILTYRIDLYFPDYKIAVECDEFAAHAHCADADKKRQNEIEQEIKCMFIRFNPDQNNFKIQVVIAEILQQIKRICLRTTQTKELS